MLLRLVQSIWGINPTRCHRIADCLGIATNQERGTRLRVQLDIVLSRTIYLGNRPCLMPRDCRLLPDCHESRMRCVARRSRVLQERGRIACPLTMSVCHIHSINCISCLEALKICVRAQLCLKILTRHQF